MKPGLRTIGAALGVCALIWPAGLSADSDGYYCTGSGYLALQLRSWNTGGPHLLQVIRFGGGEIREAGRVELPDFQPQAIRCDGDQVRIIRWTSHYIEYVIDVSGEPQLVETIEDPDLAFSPDLFDDEMSNLGDWAVPGSIELPSKDPGHEYRLRITRHSTPVSGGLEHHTRTVLIAVDVSGAVAASGETVSELLLYEGTFFESVH